jgi:hypothetical protein
MSLRLKLLFRDQSHCKCYLFRRFSFCLRLQCLKLFATVTPLLQADLISLL